MRSSGNRGNPRNLFADNEPENLARAQDLSNDSGDDVDVDDVDIVNKDNEALYADD